MTYEKIKQQIKIYEDYYKLVKFLSKVFNKSLVLFDLKLSTKEIEVIESALFDATSLYTANILKTKDEIDKYIEDYEMGVERICNRLIEQGETEEADLIKKSLHIYKEIFINVFELNSKDILKVVQYVKKKKSHYLKREKKRVKKQEKEYLEQLVEDVSNNFEIYTEEKYDRENTIHHVGTSQEYIDQFNSIITEAELMYDFYSGAISLASSPLFVVGEKDILENYYIDKTDDNGRTYCDDVARDLSDNGYKIYRGIYYKTHFLTKKNRRKLNRKLKNKM